MNFKDKVHTIPIKNLKNKLWVYSVKYRIVNSLSGLQLFLTIDLPRVFLILNIELWLIDILIFSMSSSYKGYSFRSKI
jgi:hypothetical protein